MEPDVVIVMGASGTGKTTVATGISTRMGWTFAEGDAFHPQANVDKMRAGIDPEITRAVTQANNALGTSGRVVLRPSGTEPLVRVMVEATTTESAQQVAQRLAELVAARLAL